ncbi:O-antigen ligase family protein [Polaribacter sp.]|uniref:O-antigen ligase family protein n=1 Tax=Polaribacter sp. TaxID=1920175 RepID=UPI004048263A
MPFNLFIKFGNININSTEFLLIIILLLYPFKNKNFKLPASYLFFSLFVFLSIISSIINFSFNEMSILFFRLFLYCIFIFVFYNCLNNSSKIKSIIKSIFYGYIYFSFILIIEFIYLYILSGSPSVGAIGWKNLIIKLGFYPQTVSEEQLQGWSSLGSMTGIFTVHHSLAIYLGSLFFLFLGSNFDTLINRKFRMYLLFSSLFFLTLTNSRFTLLSLLFLLIYYYRFILLKFKFKIFLIFSISFFLFNYNFENRFYNIYFTVSEIINIFSINFNNLNIVSDYIYQYSNEFASDASSSYRLLYNFNSIGLIFEYPFFGSGNLGLNLSGSEKANPHSLYLIFLQRFGLIPFSFLVYFLFIIFKKSKQFVKNGNIEIASSLLYVFLFFLIVSFGIFSLSDLRTCFIFLVSMVVILKSKNLYPEVKSVC